MPRKVLNMDFGWKFHRGDIKLDFANTHNYSYKSCKAGNASGAGGKEYSDGEWRVVDLPHDYFSESEFSADNLISHGYRHRCNAWSRKSFTLTDKELLGKQIFLCFEGTAVNAEFYFNGSIMERSFSAYTETFFDITERVYLDGRINTLAVYINGMATEGWWYEGAGIYRHVKLYAKSKLHIAHNGVFVDPTLIDEKNNEWCVNVTAEITNSEYTDRTGSLLFELFDKDEKIAEAKSEEFTLSALEMRTVPLSVNVTSPKLWDVDSPNLYRSRVTLITDGDTDTEEHRTGFRTFYADCEGGFFLNGKRLLLKGTCNHQDHAGVGVAVPDSIQYYRISRLKELGTNAYRSSHNLPAKEILDACDELGLVVMDENRRFETRREVLDYLDIMVKRDRNHPSVVFYSLFNEEPLQNNEEGGRIFQRMKAHVERLDKTRLIVGAINGTMEGAGQYMDVTGINYNAHKLKEYHRLYPTKPIVGSENNSAVTTRGCYKTDLDAHLLSNYDEEKVPWGETIRETWDVIRNNPFILGIFIWTGFDYRGEPTPFTWPSVSSQFGIMDTCGFPKDSFYYNKACFIDEPLVHILPHWNHKKGDTVRVAAVTNCDRVELFLNGRSLGEKPGDVCRTPEWQVEYEEGELMAVGYKAGYEPTYDKVKTAGAPKKLLLTPHKTGIYNDKHDTVAFNVSLVDDSDTILPNADDLIKFKVDGGFIKGVGNGDPNSHESDTAEERHLYHGLCQALISANEGAEYITVTAAAEGIEPAVITLKCEENKKALATVGSTENNILDGVTMSKIYTERPDPLMHLADNDMNSFTPTVLLPDNFSKDYKLGYRIWRLTPRIKKSGKYLLTLSKIRCEEFELYANGKRLDTVCGEKNFTNCFAVQAEFCANEGEVIDIRLLIKASGVASGVSDSIKLKFIES